MFAAYFVIFKVMCVIFICLTLYGMHYILTIKYVFITCKIVSIIQIKKDS